MKKNKLVNGFIIGTFVMLYILVSLISTIHVIDFFELSNPRGMAIALAIAFEVGAAASLASLITLDKMNKTLVWALFIAITAMQMQGNMYYAFQNLEGYSAWIELFNLVDEEPLFQKRVLAFVSGAILPLVALGFIKSLVDYIKPEDEVKVIEEDVEEPGKSSNPEEEEDLFDWERFEDSEEKLMKDFDFDNEDWEDLAEYHEAKAEDREKFLDEEEIEASQDEEEFDEDHALDQVMNDMVGDLDEAFDMVEEGYVTDELLNQEFEEEQLFDEPNDAHEHRREALKDAAELYKEVNIKEPVKDVDQAYRFGKNLYSTMVKKVNSDHLQAAPSAEAVSKAYKNLGLVNKRDDEAN